MEIEGFVEYAIALDDDKLIGGPKEGCNALTTGVRGERRTILVDHDSDRRLAGDRCWCVPGMRQAGILDAMNRKAERDPSLRRRNPGDEGILVFVQHHVGGNQIIQIRPVGKHRCKEEPREEQKE